MRKIFLSFSARLTFYILTLVFVIFGCIALVFLSYAKEKEQQQAMLYMTEKQQNTIQKIDSELSDVEMAIKIAAGEVDDMTATPDSVMNIAKNVINSNKLLKGVGIAFRPDFFPNKGRLFIEYIYKRSDKDLWFKHYGEGIGDYTERSWYKRAIQGENGFWTEPYVDNDNKSDFMVSYVYTCTDRNNRVYAVIFADVTLDDLTKNLETLRIYPNSYSFALSNKTGKYVSHISKDLVLATNYKVRAKLIDCPEMNDIGNRMITGESGAMRTKIQNNDVLLCFSTLKRTGWSICSVNRYSDVMADLGSTTIYIFVILVLGLAMLSICIRQLVKYTAKPIKKLTEAAYQIARGNFSAELPEVNTKDDLKQLHDAFANMQRSLKEHIEELKITTVAKERIESELSIAHSIQMSLVPKIFSPFPDCKKLDLYAFLDPAKEVGGDFYDFFLSNDKLYFVIADVSGKGIPASLVMAITRTLFRIMSNNAKSPVDIVSSLNNAIAKDNDTNMFVTMFAGILDMDSGELAFCNAGHNPPLILHDNNDVEFLNVDRNLPLGVMEDFNFTEQKATIDNHCGMFLYTDGLTEAEDEQKLMFGEERLKEVLTRCCALPAKEVIGCINDKLKEFVGNAEQSDDLTMFCFYINDNNTDADNEGKATFSLSMKNKIEESAKLPSFINEIGKHAKLDEASNGAINLAVEEAVVNSIMYAYPEGKYGEVKLTATVDSKEKTITFVLSDHGIEFNPLAAPEADTTLGVEEREIGGLGIFLVKQLMDKIEYKRNGDENVLTMTKNI